MFYKLFIILLIYHLQTPASGFPGLEDDLIFSGAGSGCNNGDDEDECPPLPESGSGDDDLITPVYVPPTRPPPTKKPKLKPDGEDKGKPCDDEDCFPGSGSGEVTEESTMKSTTDQTDVSITTDILSAKPTTEEESNTASHTTGSATANSTTSTFKTTERQDTTTDHQTTRVDTTVSTTSAEVHTYPTTSTTTTTERQIPPHVIIPAQENPYYKPIPSKRPERVSSETSEIVALIIGIIAGALIAVILIILVILKFKSRSDRSYKVEESKGYQQGPNAALLGNTSSTNGHHQAQYQLNGALRNGDKSAQAAQLKAKKRDSKDIKEWYV